jgi:predicted small lipoprotein YifL
MAAQSVTSEPPESQVYLPPSEKDADADPTAQQRTPLSPMSI